MLSKNIKNKNCAPKLIFVNEKKLRKIQIIFDVENWLWKSNFGTFLHLPILVNLQNWMISFDFSWFLAKSISNFVYLPWKLHNPYCHNTEKRKKKERNVKAKALLSNKLSFILFKTSSVKSSTLRCLAFLYQ